MSIDQHIEKQQALVKQPKFALETLLKAELS